MIGIRETSLEFLGRGGKRLRSRLCRAAFRVASGGVAEPAGLARVLEAVECFHKASLVHDDIQDGDEERYGKPSVWKEHGVGAAIAVGDWLVANGYRLIAESGFANAAEMLRTTVASHMALCEGQGDELLGGVEPVGGDVRRYLDICARKTGSAFALAAELGALAAGADAVLYRDYGMLFGVVFQIRDDLADGAETMASVELEAEQSAKLAALPLTERLGNWWLTKEGEMT